MMMGTVMMMAL